MCLTVEIVIPCVSTIDYLLLQTSCKMFELEETQIRKFYILRKLCDLLGGGGVRGGICAYLVVLPRTTINFAAAHCLI